MSDIATAFVDFAGDWTLRSSGLADDDGLQTAIVISLFTDRRADDDDVLPDGVNFDRRGWWGDSFSDVAKDRIGSRLWLLAREKQTAQVVERARAYAAEALKWLVDDGVAQRVAVTAEIVSPGVLGLAIEVVRGNKPVARYRFESFWKGH